MKVRSNRMRAASPLRYPGGKAAYADLVGQLVQARAARHLVEPFAGGAGLGLRLLLDGVVARLTLIEADPALATFWRVVASDQVEEMMAVFAATEASMANWERCREVISRCEESPVQVAAALLFVNRCSRSGSLRSGPVGGHAQAGDLRLGARLYHRTVNGRLAAIAEHRDRITAEHGDGIAALGRKWGCGAMLFVDPPYVRQGPKLYRRSLDEAGHGELAVALRQCRSDWVLTYDDDPLVRDLYRGIAMTPVSSSSTMNAPTGVQELLITPLLGELETPLTVSA